MYADNVDEALFVRIQCLMAANLVECMCVWLGFGVDWISAVVVWCVCMCVCAFARLAQ